MRRLAQLGDFAGYLRRIGLSGSPSWQAIHRAHAFSIPFENLDPAAGIPVSLDLGSLEDKLVRRRRGGYCFEQNLLLKAALESAGVERVDVMLARVRLGRAAGPRPRSHLLLRVVADGGVWHADVGFGSDGLLDPVPFGAGAESVQSGWRYRTVADGTEVVLQLWRDGGWVDLYGFVPEPSELIDVDVANWYTCTNPRSPFVTGIFVAAKREGTRSTLMAPIGGEGELTQRSPETLQVTPVAWVDLPSVLAGDFGLHELLPALSAAEAPRRAP